MAKSPAPPSAVVRDLERPQSGDLKPLNFKVDPEFHRAFKAYAALHGVSMIELVKTHRGGALTK
jgi:predicted HicB family RNase H-like nuclease